MAWTYNGWRSAGTAAAQLAALRSHIAEVSAKIDVETSAHGYTQSVATLNDYLRRLEESEVNLLAAGAGIAGGVSVARFAGPS